MVSRMLPAILLAGICLCIVAADVPSTTSYHLVHSFLLGGDGSWDYLTFDQSGSRLFIARSNRVMVVDPVKGSLIAEIPGTDGVHGVALAPDLGKGFTSNGRTNSVTMFDLQTLAPTESISIWGNVPDAIVYESASQRVLTFNGRSNDATIIDAKTGIAVATVALGGRPEFAAADGNGTVFSNLVDLSQVVAIDVRNARVVSRWPLAPCEHPAGMAMDQRSRRLFIGCGNQMMAIVNADTGKLLATLPIGKGSDAIGFDPDANLAFSSNGDGTLTVVHEDSADQFSVVQNADSKMYARTMAVDPKRHALYLVTAQMDEAPGANPSGPPRRTVRPGTFSLFVLSQ